ncbi:uncharacterized protein LOC108679930 [Hyalella azteca]|uniref:Uncharacterized protein LOC108679930 n=1 Tax=Hyalella azteca TaxID=294128 RepID=A0A8B7PEX6_HYAAZ|nr:uncharacterized protein LOC108679930 [Hyalella azteca]
MISLCLRYVTLYSVLCVTLTSGVSDAATVALVSPGQRLIFAFDGAHHPTTFGRHHHDVNHIARRSGPAATVQWAPRPRFVPHSPTPLHAGTFFSSRSGAPYEEVATSSGAPYDPTGHGDPAFSYWN